MSRWTYTTEAIVTVRVEWDIVAESREDAEELASRVLPLNAHEGTGAGWRGKVKLLPPGALPTPRCGKIICVEGASGGRLVRHKNPAGQSAPAK